MTYSPTEILGEYTSGTAFKQSIGNRGISEQSIINERFFIGDQWYGAKCGNDRPLVRHNVIKRIGNYKMSQILSTPISVSFSADGINTDGNGDMSYEEITRMMSAFDDYYRVTSERLNLNDINDKILRKAYISGSAVLYTYWDSTVPTNLFADSQRKHRLRGDISAEVLDIDDIVFADPYCEELQNQPYIIISSYQNGDSVLREARINGADLTQLTYISEGITDGKIRVFTKLFKEYYSDGSYTIKSVKVTEKAIVREPFDTGLHLYPLSIFCWDKRSNLIYGESEITYLIPNQIAINRMITANVWSAMTSGMPIMMVNGDTVTDKITNDPGQIIKVYGSNEDVSGAVKYVSPPVFSSEFDRSINSLIENTLTQSGANEVALGDSRADNATALQTMRNAAIMPLQINKNRFYTFAEETARIWADFWVTHYGKRYLKTKSGSDSQYVYFDSSKFRELAICVNVEVCNSATYTEQESTEILFTLFDKGIIDKRELLERLPNGAIPDIKSLLQKTEGEDTNERI